MKSGWEFDGSGVRCGHRHTGSLMWQEHTEYKDMFGTRVESQIMESLFEDEASFSKWYGTTEDSGREMIQSHL